MAKTKELKKRYGAMRESFFVSFGSRLPCERLSFQRVSDSRPQTWNGVRVTARVGVGLGLGLG